MSTSLQRILILGLVLILAAGAAFVIFRATKQETVATEEVQATASSTSDHLPAAATTTKAAPFEASLETLMSSGKEYGCHYTSPPEEGNITGTIFVSDGRARGTLVGDIFDIPGSLVYFILNGEKVYLWFVSDGFDEVAKGKSLLIQATSTEDKEEMRRDIKKNLTNLYGCVSWEFDDGFFELPRDTQFIDFTGKPVAL